MTNGLKRFSPYRRLKKRFIPVRSLIFPDGIPFWPRKGFSEKQLATFTTGWKLSKSSPEVFKRILALQGTEKETTSLIITLK
ncbi:DUF4933 domain-containing protein [Bacteroides fragilis]|nr:DUF4933 domain-containing protein [Bacteroides fragilis]